jgi:hypothetical protein
LGAFAACSPLTGSLWWWGRHRSSFRRLGLVPEARARVEA